MDHQEQQPQGGAHRSNRVLGGSETVIDETGEKMKDEFLTFLESYHPRDRPPVC